jgi:hypothetical protein
VVIVVGFTSGGWGGAEGSGGAGASQAGGLDGVREAIKRVDGIIDRTTAKAAAAATPRPRDGQ